MRFRFAQDEVEKLVALAGSAARGRTIAERMTETFAGLRALVPNTGGNLFVLDVVRDRGDALWVEGITRRELDEYVSHYRHSDPMGKFLVGAPNQVKTLSDAATLREIEGTEFSDLLNRLPVRSVAGYSQKIRGGRYVATALHRPPGMPDFKPRERAIIELVMPLVVACAEQHLRGSNPFDSLTRMERLVVELLVRGLPDRAIAHHLGVGFATVRTHLQRTFAKLGVSSRTELVGAIVQSCRPLTVE